jgi:hypothetical protein
MPVCKNNPNRKYKGTEPSPKGLGWCASGEKIGKKRKGKDGNMWIIKKVSNGSKRWMKYSKTKTESKTKSKTKLNKNQLQTLSILKNDIKKKLSKIGVKTYIFTNKKINDKYFIDNAWDYVEKKLGNDYLDSKFIIVVIKKDNNNIVLDKGGVYIQHNNIKYTTKKELISIFKKYLKNKFIWNGNQNKSIFVKL